MRVLFVTDYAAPYAGNFIRSIRRLCEKMEGCRYQAYFVFSDACRQSDWALRLGEKYPVSFKTSFGNLLRQICANKVDLIYTHFCLPKTQCYAKTAARLCGVPLAQHWHNHYQKGQGIKGALCDWAFEGDMNIGCSKPVADSLPYPENKKTYADNAIDFGRLDQYDASFCFEGAARAQVALMFGFDLYRKGVDLVLEAMAPIAQQKNLVLAISLSKNHERVLSYIQQKYGNCPSWVNIVDARDDVATYYRAADMFISAAREEGLCYAPLEAAYCGCNIISSEIDGVPYAKIPHCKTFPSEDIGLLRKAIVESLVPHTPEQKKETAAAIVAQFDLDRWAEREIEILEMGFGGRPIS